MAGRKIPYGDYVIEVRVTAAKGPVWITDVVSSVSAMKRIIDKTSAQHAKDAQGYAPRFDLHFTPNMETVVVMSDGKEIVRVHERDFGGDMTDAVEGPLLGALRGKGYPPAALYREFTAMWKRARSKLEKRLRS